MTLVSSKNHLAVARDKLAITPPKPPAINLVERFDLSYQAVVQMQTKTFLANAVIDPSGFRILDLARRSGGEAWPMRGEESFEYSAMVAQLAATVPATRAKLKGL